MSQVLPARAMICCFDRRFDWFFKSRTPQELARRAETLIRLIEKEQEDENVSPTAADANLHYCRRLKLCTGSGCSESIALST